MRTVFCFAMSLLQDRRALGASAIFAALIFATESVAAQSAPLITGRITDAVTGGGVGNVELTLSDGTATATSPDGSYRLRAIEPSRTTLSVRRAGYAPLTRELTLANGQTLSLSFELIPIPVALTTERVTAARPPSQPGVSVITRGDIERNGGRDLADVLRNEAGVTLTPRGGPGAPVAISIRGSSANQVLVLLDGLPLNDAVSGVADLSTVDPASIETVTIIRGAQSSRYGGQALGGVILVTTRRPATLAPQMTLGVGQWGERRLGSIVAIDQRESESIISGSLGGSWQSLRGDFTTALPVERGGGQTRRLNADVERLSLNGTGSVRFRAAMLDLRADLATTSRGMPGSIVQPSLDAHQRQQRYGISAQLESAPRPGVGLHANIGVQQQRGRFRDSVPPFGAPYDQRQNVTVAVAGLRTDGARGNTTLTIGSEARSTRVSSSELSSTAPRNITSGGAWLGATQRYTASRWVLEVGTGVRADVGTLWHGAYVSPSINVSAARGPLRMSTSWRSAFAAPSLGDLFFQEGVQVRPNPALRPERVRGEWTASGEFAGTIAFGMRATTTVSAFRGDINDLILWSPDFRFIWSPNNFAVSRRGVESSLRLATANQTLALTLNGAAVDTRYRGNVLSGQVIYRPRLTGAATLDLSTALADAQLALQSAGPRRTVVGSDINRLAAFQMVEAQLSRRFTFAQLDTRFRMRVENLLDQSVSMLVDYPVPGRTWSFDATISPRARRRRGTIPSPVLQHP